MENNEVFSRAIAQAVEGMMFHSQMAEYFWFLGLPKYAEEQEEHFTSESKGLASIKQFYIRRYGMLPETGNVTDPKAIPTSWYGYSRDKVGQNIKANAVKNGFDAWIRWERDAHTNYSVLAKYLEDAGEGSAAALLRDLARGAEDEELTANEHYMALNDTEFDMVYIHNEQSKQTALK